MLFAKQGGFPSFSGGGGGDEVNEMIRLASLVFVLRRSRCISREALEGVSLSVEARPNTIDSGHESATANQMFLDERLRTVLV